MMLLGDFNYKTRVKYLCLVSAAWMMEMRMLVSSQQLKSEPLFDLPVSINAAK